MRMHTGFLNCALTSVTTARMLSSFSNISLVFSPPPIIDPIWETSRKVSQGTLSARGPERDRPGSALGRNDRRGRSAC